MKFCNLRLIVPFVIFATCGLAETAQKKQLLSYEPAVVELKGKLIIKTYYGPPNYGENPDTDAKEAMPFLVLDKPVSVRGNPDPKARFDRQTVENVKKIQLVLTLPHKNLIGAKVIVTGTLFQAFTGHHHTDVLMTVSSIKRAPEPR